MFSHKCFLTKYNGSFKTYQSIILHALNFFLQNFSRLSPNILSKYIFFGQNCFLRDTTQIALNNLRRKLHHSKNEALNNLSISCQRITINFVRGVVVGNSTFRTFAFLISTFKFADICFGCLLKNSGKINLISTTNSSNIVYATIYKKNYYKTFVCLSVFICF